MRGDERIGDHGDPGAETRQQCQRAYGLPAAPLRRLLNDQRGGDPDDEHLEADGKEPEKRQVGKRRHKGAGEIDQGETANADRDQPPPAETVRKHREWNSPESADRQDRTE